MLILTRNEGDNLRVGDDIKITVLRLSGSQIKLGVEAPEHITVYREEIYTRIQEDNINHDND